MLFGGRAVLTLQKAGQKMFKERYLYLKEERVYYFTGRTIFKKRAENNSSGRVLYKKRGIH